MLAKEGPKGNHHLASVFFLVPALYICSSVLLGAVRRRSKQSESTTR